MKRVLTAAVLLLCASAALVGSAQATQPQAQTIEMVARLTGPDTTAGTWAGAGFVDDAGTYTETFRFAGRTIHAKKVLVGSKGTIVLRVEAVVVWLSPCTVAFEAGNWRIVDGSGSYERRRAGAHARQRRRRLHRRDPRHAWRHGPYRLTASDRRGTGPGRRRSSLRVRSRPRAR
jgi:opacity protein-like surface antigen